jgi:endoglucanase
MIGINLSGAEFGKAIPGVHGVDYAYPTADLKAYAEQGITLVRLPFRWERMQPQLNGPLNQAELGRLKNFLSEADRQGIDVVIDNHNYGRFNGKPIGDPAVPAQAFADFWKKIAVELKDSFALVGYDLMNEPHHMGGISRWPNAAQLATNAIRSVDMSRDIYVAGQGWSNTTTWQEVSGTLDIIDPANKIIYEAHQYFDGDSSGSYNQSFTGEGGYANVGVDRIKPFAEWLKETGNRGTLGEFAVPDTDPRWLTVLDNAMDYMDAQGIDGMYWGGGSRWGDYQLSPLAPNGQPNPQMAIIRDHADDTNPPPAATPAEGGAGNDTLYGTSGKDELNGHAGNDNLNGRANPDILRGEGGNDTLNGSTGADTMVGGTGNDTYVVDVAQDIVTELAGGGTDRVIATATYTLTANVEDLSLYGNMAVNGIGNELGNRITGNPGANQINGKDGNDIIRGASGADMLTGGNGADRFDFDLLADSSASAIDRITDFTRGLDKLDLSSIDANSQTAGDQPFTPIGTASFTGAAGQIRYVFNDLTGTGNDHLLFQADVNGDAVSDFDLRVDGPAPLSAADLVL